MILLARISSRASEAERRQRSGIDIVWKRGKGGGEGASAVRAEEQKRGRGEGERGRGRARRRAAGAAVLQSLLPRILLPPSDDFVPTRFRKNPLSALSRAGKKAAGREEAREVAEERGEKNRTKIGERRRNSGGRRREGNDRLTVSQEIDDSCFTGRSVTEEGGARERQDCARN